MGKLKWTPYEYYTSSPYEFYHACKGYFDEREESMLIMRKVAYSFVGGSLIEFNNFWPVEGKGGPEKIVIDQDMKDIIKKIHGVNLKNVPGV